MWGLLNKILLDAIERIIIDKRKRGILLGVPIIVLFFTLLISLTYMTKKTLLLTNQTTDKNMNLIFAKKNSLTIGHIQKVIVKDGEVIRSIIYPKLRWVQIYRKSNPFTYTNEYELYIETIKKED